NQEVRSALALPAQPSQERNVRSGRVLLLRDDGTVISAANVGPELRLKADELRHQGTTPQGSLVGRAPATRPKHSPIESSGEESCQCFILRRRGVEAYR